MAKDIVHIINMQSNKMNMIQHIAKDFYWKYLNLTLLVIIKIFMSNCNLITHISSVSVTD